jgi:enoyl-CoA hydratase/carnithine racemase
MTRVAHGGRAVASRVVSAIEIDENVLAAARREADRRGVDVAVVVNEAIQRFVVGADLRELLDELRERDAAQEGLDEATALQVANEELAAVREGQA